MSSRSAVVGIALAIVSIAPLASIAHAQDLDCPDFRFQEDAQAVFDRDTSDPNRLDEDQGPDDGIACEALPRRSGTNAVPPVSPSATALRPVRPSATALHPVVPVMPTRGTRAGVGGASGPTDLAVGAGLALFVGSAGASGYLVVRRLVRGSKQT